MGTLTHDYRRLRHILVHRHQNSNPQHWFHVILADESRASLYQLWESTVPRGKVDWDWSKVFVYKTVSNTSWCNFVYFPPIEIDVFVHQLWGKTVAPMWWFYSVTGSLCLTAVSGFILCSLNWRHRSNNWRTTSRPNLLISHVNKLCF